VDRHGTCHWVRAGALFVGSLLCLARANSTAFDRSQFDRVVDAAQLVCVEFALLLELLLQLSSFLFLGLKFVLNVSQLASHVFDLSVFLIFDEFVLVKTCFELAVQFHFFFLPLSHLCLELLNLAFEVVHMDFHLVLKLNSNCQTIQMDPSNLP
jgi:hypothetical protein